MICLTHTNGLWKSLMHFISAWYFIVTQWMLVSPIKVTKVIISYFFFYPIMNPHVILLLRSFLNLSLALVLAQKAFYWDAHPWVEVESSWATKSSSSSDRSPESTGKTSPPHFPSPAYIFSATCPDIHPHRIYSSMFLFMSAWGGPCGKDTQFIAVPQRWVNSGGWWWGFPLARDFLRQEEEYTGQKGIAASRGCHPQRGQLAGRQEEEEKMYNTTMTLFGICFQQGSLWLGLKICLHPTESPGSRKLLWKVFLWSGLENSTISTFYLLLFHLFVVSHRKSGCRIHLPGTPCGCCSWFNQGLCCHSG